MPLLLGDLHHSVWASLCVGSFVMMVLAMNMGDWLVDGKVRTDALGVDRHNIPFTWH